MKNWREIALMVLGGIGWLLYGVNLLMAGAMDSGVWWVCLLALVLGAGLVFCGIDKALEPPKRW